MEHATPCDSSKGVRHLQRRDLHRSLADRDRNCLTRPPLVMEDFLDPFGRRDQAAFLGRKVYPRARAEAQMFGKEGDFIDPQHFPEGPKINIARVNDGIMQVHASVAVPFFEGPIVERVAVYRDLARAKDDKIG